CAGIARWVWIGLIPMAGSAVAWLARARRKGGAAVAAVAVSCVAAVAAILAFPVADVDQYKAVRALVAQAGTRQHDRDIRLASYQYSQPSLVYYNRREVKPLSSDEQVAEFLANPFPAYLFVTETAWQGVQERRPDLRRSLVARKWDLYRRCDVLVITNQ